MLIIIGVLAILVANEAKQYVVPKDYFEGYIREEKMYLDRKVYTLYSIKTDNAKTDKTILYIHGGAYTAVMSKHHWSFLKNIIDDLGCKIIVPEYPLIPEGNYKDVYEFIYPLYKDVLKEIGTDKLILVGDSAGGGLSLALCQKNGDDNIPEPSKTILISPWLDVRMDNPEIKDVQKYDKDLNRVTLKIAGDIYAGKDGESKYFVNPIMGPLDKLKNVTIFTGTYDILNPDVHILAEKAKNINADISIDETEGAGHIWFIKRKSDYTEMEASSYAKFLKVIKGDEENK